MRESAIEDKDRQTAWLQDTVFPEQRRLAERCPFLYAVARAHGASDAELSNPAGAAVL